ncbi:extracellular matrix regulator RemB [Bacillus sp. FJAT-45037]|uniref:extracellular matrix regulator RemB n=1 Tax=Bacillus sp. FJAT-45037 TaxID=2011007 RepID=UPI000C23F64B|nr:extracellular matrix/biofilm biosynthesis regulator RemA family protein [Bacillus sp. FJAT-45037]
MFIHLGGDIIIRSKEIIAILDRDVEDMSMVTKTYLEKENELKRCTVISEDYIKSIVITDEAIYFSPVSSLTLNKRAQAVSEIDLVTVNEG